MSCKTSLSCKSGNEMKVSIVSTLGRLIKRLPHFFRRKDCKIAQNINADYKHMRELERIQPYNETYERMKRHGKH